MPRHSGIANAELRFRQMCCTAVGGPLIAPMLFRELHQVLPFATCLYLWLGPSGPVDAYFNIPEVGRYLPLYTEQYFRRQESEIWATTDEAAQTQFGPRLLNQVLRVSTAAYYLHPVYNEILRPSNVHTFLRMLVRDSGRPVGTFSIGRGQHERAFDEVDQQLLDRLQPFIVHALIQRHDLTGGDLVDAESAILVVDPSARPVWMSSEAPALLAMSQGSALAPPTVHEGIARSVRALHRLRHGDDPITVPAWRTCNAWGQFTARCYWMEDTGSQPLIGVFLNRQVPSALRLLEGLRHFALPARQQEVALLLALGNSEIQVASTLGVGHSTVIHHRRQIYNSLEVDSRSQLVSRLHSAVGTGIKRPTTSLT